MTRQFTFRADREERSKTFVWNKRTEFVRAISFVDAGALREAHCALASALVESDAVDKLSAGLRHYVQGGDGVAAARVFTRVIARARRSGDPRHARDILSDLLGDRLPDAMQQQLMAAVPWRHRSARFRTRAWLVAAALLCVVTTGAAWSTWRTPSLAFRQSAVMSVPANMYGKDVFRLLPSIIVAGSTGETRDVLSARNVRVRSLKAGATIVAGENVNVENGVASFNNLRVRTSDSTILLRFEAEGRSPIDIELVASREGSAPRAGNNRLQLAEAQFGSQRVRGPNASITVDRGSLITGVVQIQYTATWPAASVWLSMTPTWGDAKEMGRDLTPVPTPVNSDIIDMSIGVPAPKEPGRYWLLFALDAEDAGGYLLSRTNWTLEEPVWGDGNDVANLPDSTIRRANVEGVIETRMAFPENWQRAEELCARTERKARGVKMKYCVAYLPLMGIEVVVR